MDSEAYGQKSVHMITLFLVLMTLYFNVFFSSSNTFDVAYQSIILLSWLKCWNFNQKYTKCSCLQLKRPTIVFISLKKHWIYAVQH